ncbi:MAG: hypothetical protein AAB257_02805 [Nitrospinota bacterium]|jgi:hypothetical protein
MDSNSLTLYDQFASISWLKKVVKILVPKKVISTMRPSSESQVISKDDRKGVEKTLAMMHSLSKGIVGMKVIAEGKLRGDAQKAIKYAKSLPFVDSFIIGMFNKDEIDENCRIVKEVLI